MAPTDLRSLARAVTPIALDIYDKQDPLTILRWLAQVVSNPGKEKTLTLEWWTAFPKLRKWVGERTVQRYFQHDLVIKSEPYEITEQIDQWDLDRENTLVNLADIASKMGSAFAKGKVMFCYRLLRRNPLTYDGQSFFDTDHTHPDGTTYSNIIAVTRASAANPTVAEARAELDKCLFQLMVNRIVTDELVSAQEQGAGLVVVTKAREVFLSYRRLLLDPLIGTEPNPYKGAFSLYLDANPNPGEELGVDVVEALPDGPRPVVFVPTREPSGVEFDASKAFSHNKVPFGMAGEFGLAAGFPQTAVRATPS
jgi:hypothetical protein